ncbi:MAG: EI24 domain-containing protein [Brumimicrobium sp.]|nr:EI24 domain-containing protein [Brumimicrobium sp.]
MQFIRHFSLGIKNYWKAIIYIRKYRLYWFLPIPALLMLVLYYIGSRIASWQASWDPRLGCLECSNMNETIWFMLKMLLSISLGLVLMKFAKYLVVIILSPLFSIISQMVEKQLTNNQYPFSLRQTVHDVRRGIRIALRNVMWEYIFFLIILLVSAIGWEEAHKSPVFYLTFVIGFFYYGFSFIDYINERRRLDIDQSIHFMRNHRGLAIAIGAIYSILILVPVNIGSMTNFDGFLDHPWQTIWTVFSQLILWFLASSAPILAIVAATLSMHDLVDLNSNKYSVKAAANENVEKDNYRDEDEIMS